MEDITQDQGSQSRKLNVKLTEGFLDPRTEKEPPQTGRHCLNRETDSENEHKHWK